MADEEKIEGEEVAPPKKKGKGMLIIIAVVVVVALAVGGGAYFFLKKSGGGSAGEAGHGKTEGSKEGGKEGGKAGEGAMLVLEPFVVNLNEQNGNRFLKVALQLEMSDPKFVEMAKSKNPQIRDAIITLLTSKTADTLMLPEGKLQLKDEITIRANQIFGENTVKNVYLTDFVMQ
jgi:flagellar FliL protein